MLSSIKKQALVYTEPAKCICENKNGLGPRGHLLCKDEGDFERLEGCAEDEWCVGPYDAKDASTFDKGDFCMKGRISSYYSLDICKN